MPGTGQDVAGCSSLALLTSLEVLPHGWLRQQPAKLGGSAPDVPLQRLESQVADKLLIDLDDLPPEDITTFRLVYGPGPKSASEQVQLPHLCGKPHTTALWRVIQDVGCRPILPGASNL